MMREATANDLDRIVDMGLRFVRETRYVKLISENPARMRDIVEKLMLADDGLVLVSDHDGVLTGMLGAYVFEHLVSGERTASEMFWWTEPESRGDGVKLLRYAERWAAGRGAMRFQMIAPTDRVGKFYEALGYEMVETTYQREL